MIYEGPFFGIIITIAAFETGLFLYKKTEFSIFNPILISISLIVTYIILTDVTFDQYQQGGQFISFFLKPVTVILAVPLYKQQVHLKKYFKEIFAGIFLGCIAAITSVIVFAKIFNLNSQLVLSLIPKSVTAPIGLELSKSLGGLPAITIVTIVVTGITGGVIAPFVIRLFKIQNPVARGIAIGTSSHAIGTAKAMEMGETEGAMSGLAIGITGLVTVLIAPLIVYLIN